MAKTQKQSLPIKYFNKGLITDVNPLAFPADASIDERNMELLKDGTRRRRRGRTSVGTVSTSIIGLKANEHNPVVSFVWGSAGNQGGFDILVVQCGNYVGFFKNNVSDPFSQPIMQTTFLGLPSDFRAQLASVNGRLLMTSGGEEIIVFEYSTLTGNITSQTIRLQVRDLWGVETGLALNQRLFSSPESNAKYLYNKFNGGWPWFPPYKVEDIYGNYYTRQIAPLFAVDGGRHQIWPAESDVYADYSYKDDRDNNVFASKMLSSSVATNSTGLRGKSVLDIFNRGASRKVNYSSWRGGSTYSEQIPQDESFGSVSSVASFAGRAWYAITESSRAGSDIRTPNLGSLIFYSQTVSSTSDLNRCYAENDPTSLDYGDILDTDGGFISIPEMGKVIRMEVIADSLIIIATNGIWEVYGGDAGFSATAQTVSKLATLFGVYEQSVVVAGGFLSFWDSEGIVVVSKNPAEFQSNLVRITDNKIRTAYNAIPSIQKNRVVGTFIPKLRQVRWLFDTSENVVRGFNQELIYDLDFQAFTLNVFPDNKGVGYRQTSLLSTSITDEDVTTNVGLTVTNNSAQTVTVPISSSSSEDQDAVQYLVAQDFSTSGGTLRIATLSNDVTFGDDGFAPTAYLLTGYVVGEDSSKDLRSPCVTVHMKRTESGFGTDFIGSESYQYLLNPSSCLLQGRWEWTDSAAAGKWGASREVYRLPKMYLQSGTGFDYGYSIITTENKVRGSGRALSLLFSSSNSIPNNPYNGDLHIYGWTVEITAETD